jgi:hypothetical protein
MTIQRDDGVLPSGFLSANAASAGSGDQPEVGKWLSWYRRALFDDGGQWMVMLDNKLYLVSVVWFLCRSRVDCGTRGGKVVVGTDLSKQKVQSLTKQRTDGAPWAVPLFSLLIFCSYWWDGRKWPHHNRIATERLKDDYELLYAIIGKKKEMLMMTIGVKDDVASEEYKRKKELIAIAHNIMVYYAEKERSNPKRNKGYKPKIWQYILEAGLKQFGNKGELAVTKELN